MQELLAVPIDQLPNILSLEVPRNLRALAYSRNQNLKYSFFLDVSRKSVSYSGRNGCLAESFRGFLYVIKHLHETYVTRARI